MTRRVAQLPSAIRIFDGKDRPLFDKPLVGDRHLGCISLTRAGCDDDWTIFSGNSHANLQVLGSNSREIGFAVDKNGVHRSFRYIDRYCVHLKSDSILIGRNAILHAFHFPP